MCNFSDTCTDKQKAQKTDCSVSKSWMTQAASLPTQRVNKVDIFKIQRESF